MSDNTYTDDAFLHMFFRHYLKNMYPNDFYRNAVCNGIEEPLDPDYLAAFMYELADRLGLKLVNNMWEKI